MTEECRQRANELHHEIESLEGRIKTLQSINSSGKSIQIRSDEVGMVQVEAGDYEPAIDYIIDMLEDQLRDKEDAFRML